MNLPNPSRPRFVEYAARCRFIAERTAIPGGPMKSSVEEIQRRFDADVEHISDLQTGQSATVGAPLAMALGVEGQPRPPRHPARHVLDVGCGAGNYTLKLLEFLPNLERHARRSEQADARTSGRANPGKVTSGSITLIQGDVRAVDPQKDTKFDVILAAADPAPSADRRRVARGVDSTPIQSH